MKIFMIENPLPVRTIEIDEAVITSRRQGLIGRFPGALLWILGFYHRQNRYGYLFLIPNRQSQTIMPLIHNFISNQSTLYTDEFSTYVRRNGTSRIETSLPQKNLTHFWVNHSAGWTSIFNNSIHERLWREMRNMVRKNTRLSQIESYLNFFNFYAIYSSSFAIPETFANFGI